MAVAKKIIVPFAKTGDRTSIPDEIQANGSVSREKGFTDHYELEYDNPNAKDIERGIFNEIEHTQDAAIAEMQQFGLSVFSDENGYVYPKGALSFYNGQVYQSLKNDNSSNPELKDWSMLSGGTPITGGYNSTRRYESGDIVKEGGIYYECYPQEGCKGIDPTDLANRPSGWTSTDQDKPYYWIKIGRSLMLPEIGSPIPLATTNIREGLIKYRNDATLSALKFWRIAELYPNLVNNGVIEIADLRAMVIRGLDDGRGIDVGRAINSYQEDATSAKNLSFKVHRPKANTYPPIGGGNNLLPLNINANGSYADMLDAALIFSTSNETRMKNIAMLYACRI